MGGSSGFEVGIGTLTTADNVKKKIYGAASWSVLKVQAACSGNIRQAEISSDYRLEERNPLMSLLYKISITSPSCHL